MKGIRVSGIDPKTFEVHLWRYFPHATEIYYPLLNNDAVIFFDSPEAATKEVERGHDTWKIRLLPPQVFETVVAYVESDLSNIVLATPRYITDLAYIGQLKVLNHIDTRQASLTGLPHQIEWGWSYLMRIQENQKHIASSLQSLANRSRDANTDNLEKQSSPQPPRLEPMPKDAEVGLHGKDEKDPSSPDQAGPQKERRTVRFEGLPGQPSSPQEQRGAGLMEHRITHVLASSQSSYDSEAGEACDEEDNTHAVGRSHTEVEGSTGTSGPSLEAPSLQDSSNLMYFMGAPSDKTTTKANKQGKMTYLKPDEDADDVSKSGDGREVQEDYMAAASPQPSQCPYHAATDDKKTETETKDKLESETWHAGEDNGASASAGESWTSQYAEDEELSMQDSAFGDLSCRSFDIGHDWAMGLTLKIYVGDITRCQTSAIVNPTSSNLNSAAWGGVASVICKAGGHEMEQECYKTYLKIGALRPGEVVKINAYGRLSHLDCVLHTMAPYSAKHNSQATVMELTQTIGSCMKFADESWGLESIAFPFVATGSNGLTVEDCVQAFVTSMLVFGYNRLAKAPMGDYSPTLREVHFVNTDVNNVVEAVLVAQEIVAMETVESAMKRLSEGRKKYAQFATELFTAAAHRGKVQVPQVIETDAATANADNWTKRHAAGQQTQTLSRQTSHDKPKEHAADETRDHKAEYTAEPRMGNKTNTRTDDKPENRGDYKAGGKADDKESRANKGETHWSGQERVGSLGHGAIEQRNIADNTNGTFNGVKLEEDGRSNIEIHSQVKRSHGITSEANEEKWKRESAQGGLEMGIKEAQRCFPTDHSSKSDGVEELSKKYDDSTWKADDDDDNENFDDSNSEDEEERERGKGNKKEAKNNTEEKEFNEMEGDWESGGENKSIIESDEGEGEGDDDEETKKSENDEKESDDEKSYTEEYEKEDIGKDRSDVSSEGEEEACDKCPVCLEPIKGRKALPCGHVFCKRCVDTAVSVSPKCPQCQRSLAVLTGTQPPGGSMTFTVNRHTSLPGHEGSGTIVIQYFIPAGVQEAHHPRPGQAYDGLHTTAYLPDTSEGNEILKMLRKAFENGLTFTVRRASAGQKKGVIAWDEISHKTSTSGGPQAHGYPDPGYLKQVREDLSAKGIFSP